MESEARQREDGEAGQVAGAAVERGSSERPGSRQHTPDAPQDRAGKAGSDDAGGGSGRKRRQSAQLETEVAQMLSGLSGDNGGGNDDAGTQAGGGTPPTAASVPSTEGLPVLPDVVRNKDLKRELPLICHVLGCGIDLTTQADYYQRYRICKEHLKSPAMLVDGIPQRFCQQCGRFHELKEFDSDKRNCRARLQQHNSRRRKVFAMSQELKRNKFAKSDSCLADPQSEAEAAMAAALAASGAWGAAGLPPLPLPPMPTPIGTDALPFASLPPMPMPLPIVTSEPLPPIDPQALAAAAAVAGRAGDAALAGEGSQGERAAGVKRDFSSMDGVGSEASAGVQRLLQETARSLGWRPEGGGGGGGGGGGAEQHVEDDGLDALLAERYQQMLMGAGVSNRRLGAKDLDPARLFGGPPEPDALRTSLLGRLSPPPEEGGRGGGGGGWPALPANSGGHPSSALLEQMAMRMLQNSTPRGGGGGGRLDGLDGSRRGGSGRGGSGCWGAAGPAGRDQSETQALAAAYPELAAQIQSLSQQLQAVQAQLAMVLPGGGSEDSGGALSGGAAPSSTGPLGSAGGGGGGGWDAVLGAMNRSSAARQAPPAHAREQGWGPPAARPPPLQRQPSCNGGGGGSGGTYTAEDLIRAFAAGMQQNTGRGGSGGGDFDHDESSSLEHLLARATGLTPPQSALADRSSSRQPVRRGDGGVPPAPGSPTSDLPPNAWSMLNALLNEGLGSPGHNARSHSVGAAGLPRRPAAPPSAFEQLTAAMRAAEAPSGGRGDRLRGGGGGGDAASMQDMLALLASLGGPRGGGGL